MSSSSYSALAQRTLVAPNPKHHKARTVRAGNKKYQWWGSSTTIGVSRSSEDLRAKAQAAAKEAPAADELPPTE